jgi:hypothetical protein
LKKKQVLKKKLILIISLTFIFQTTIILASFLHKKNDLSAQNITHPVNLEEQPNKIITKIIDNKNKAAFNIRLTNPQKTIDQANSALLL